jgi:hypothetical protein
MGPVFRLGRNPTLRLILGGKIADMACRAVSRSYGNGPATVLNHSCVEFGFLAHAPNILEQVHFPGRPAAKINLIPLPLDASPPMNSLQIEAQRGPLLFPIASPVKDRLEIAGGHRHPSYIPWLWNTFWQLLLSFVRFSCKHC